MCVCVCMFICVYTQPCVLNVLEMFLLRVHYSFSKIAMPVLLRGSF